LFIVFSRLGLLSCIELCNFCVIWFCLLVRWHCFWLGRLLCKRIRGTAWCAIQIDNYYYYSRDISHVGGFPLQILVVLLYVFPTRNIFIFFINFTFLTATYFSKSRYSLFMLIVLLNPNQSITGFSGLVAVLRYIDQYEKCPHPLSNC